MERCCRGLVVALSLMSACGSEAAGESSVEEAEGGINPPVRGECIALGTMLSSDYTPGADDAFPACVSDDGEFHPIGASISSVARVQAFEEIGKLLFDESRPLAAEDFLSARMIYDEDEGIGSRVERRYDPHYQVEGEADCKKVDDVADNPDYCAGPAMILPLLQTSFREGYAGRELRWHAGRIEGALLWFFAISEYKETLSCADGDIGDCDSAYGYFDGAGRGIGLGARIEAVDPDAYATASLGALAIRCWRDVDDALPAKNVTLREAARTQFDRGTIDGVLSVIADRAATAQKASGQAQKFHWGFVTALLGAVQSQTWRSAGADDVVRAARKSRSPDDVDVDGLLAALEGMASCTP